MVLDHDSWTGKVYVDGSVGRRRARRRPDRRTGHRRRARPVRRGLDRTTSRRPRRAPPRRSVSGPRSRTPNAPPCCGGPATSGRSTPRSSPEWNVREVGAIPRHGRIRPARRRRGVLRRVRARRAPRYGELLPSERAATVDGHAACPVGVVGVIAPFNVPLILGIRSVAPALALGNAVVLKPDPRTAVTGGVNIVRVFEEAGLPAGVLQVLPGRRRRRRGPGDRPEHRG